MASTLSSSSSSTVRNTRSNSITPSTTAKSLSPYDPNRYTAISIKLHDQLQVLFGLDPLPTVNRTVDPQHNDIVLRWFLTYKYEELEDMLKQGKLPPIPQSLWDYHNVNFSDAEVGDAGDEREEENDTDPLLSQTRAPSSSSSAPLTSPPASVAIPPIEGDQKATIIGDAIPAGEVVAKSLMQGRPISVKKVAKRIANTHVASNNNAIAEKKGVSMHPSVDLAAMMSMVSSLSLTIANLTNQVNRLNEEKEAANHPEAGMIYANLHQPEVRIKERMYGARESHVRPIGVGVQIAFSAKLRAQLATVMADKGKSKRTVQELNFHISLMETLNLIRIYVERCLGNVDDQKQQDELKDMVAFAIDMVYARAEQMHISTTTTGGWDQAADMSRMYMLQSGVGVTTRELELMRKLAPQSKGDKKNGGSSRTKKGSQKASSQSSTRVINGVIVKKESLKSPPSTGSGSNKGVKKVPSNKGNPQ